MKTTDRYQKIRQALAKGITPGPWEVRDDRTDTVESAQGYPVCTVHWHPDERYGHGSRAAYIAACDPDTIRELLEERDALAAALEAALVDAERYRLLRKGAVEDVAVVRGLGAMDYGMSAVIYTYSEEIDGDDLDAAIDSAMQQGGAA